MHRAEDAQAVPVRVARGVEALDRLQHQVGPLRRTDEAARGDEGERRGLAWRPRADRRQVGERQVDLLHAVRLGDQPVDAAEPLEVHLTAALELASVGKLACGWALSAGR